MKDFLMFPIKTLIAVAIGMTVMLYKAVPIALGVFLGLVMYSWL